MYQRLMMAFCFLLILVLHWTIVPSPGGLCASDDDKTWSFDFQNLSITEVLAEITRVTGINIVASRLPEDRVLRKSYKEKTVEAVLRDVFKGTNVGLILHHGEKGIDRIDIWIPDGGSVSSSRSFSTVEDKNQQILKQWQRGRNAVSIEPNAQDLDDQTTNDEQESNETDEDEELTNEPIGLKRRPRPMPALENPEGESPTDKLDQEEDSRDTENEDDEKPEPAPPGEEGSDVE